MLTVYAIPTSLYCAKLRVLLRHKNLTWEELLPPGGYGSAEYRDIAPTGNLPALRDGDLLLTDSECIAEYLEEKYPAHPALPVDLGERARTREMSRFHDTRLEPELRRLFPQIGADRDAGLIERQCVAIGERIRQLGIMLESRPGAGSSLTLGDCGFAITFIWIDRLSVLFGSLIEWPDAILSYRKRLEKLDSVSSELQAYVPVVDTWLATKAG